MPDYMLLVSDNGTIYYDFNTTANGDAYVLYDSGEAVSPDELEGYAFSEIEVDEIKPFNEYPLYNEFQSR